MRNGRKWFLINKKKTQAVVESLIIITLQYCRDRWEVPQKWYKYIKKQKNYKSFFKNLNNNLQKPNLRLGFDIEISQEITILTSISLFPSLRLWKNSPSLSSTDSV